MNIFTHKPANPAAALPSVVSLEEACSWVKVDLDDPDMARLIKVAMVRVEEICQQPLFGRDFIVTLRAFACGTFDSLYVSQIVKVEYRIKGETALTELDAAEYDLFENDLMFSAAAFQLANVDRVRIQFTAGFAKIPETIWMAMALLIGDWYENRGDTKRAAPSAVDALLAPYKLPRV